MGHAFRTCSGLQSTCILPLQVLLRIIVAAQWLPDRRGGLVSQLRCRGDIATAIRLRCNTKY